MMSDKAKDDARVLKLIPVDHAAQPLTDYVFLPWVGLSGQWFKIERS